MEPPAGWAANVNVNGKARAAGDQHSAANQQREHGVQMSEFHDVSPLFWNDGLRLRIGVDHAVEVAHAAVLADAEALHGGRHVEGQAHGIETADVDIRRDERQRGDKAAFSVTVPLRTRYAWTARTRSCHARCRHGIGEAHIDADHARRHVFLADDLGGESGRPGSCTAPVTNTVSDALLWTVMTLVLCAVTVMLSELPMRAPAGGASVTVTWRGAAGQRQRGGRDRGDVVLVVGALMPKVPAGPSLRIWYVSMVVTPGRRSCRDGGVTDTVCGCTITLTRR